MFYNLCHSLLPAYCGCRTAPEVKYPYAQFNKKDNFTNSIWSKDSKKELNTRVKEIKLY